MSTNNAFTPADRARALARAHRITVATGVGGLAAVVTFAGLAAVSLPGSQTTTAASGTSTQTTDVTDGTTDTTEQTTGGFAAPAQPPTNASGGGHTSTGGS